MNVAFLVIILASVVFAAITGTADAVSMGALNGAKAAVELVLSLAGSITFFLGLTAIVEEAGGLKLMARVIRPVMRRLFPEIPADHPAMGAMVMNLAANAIGLGNAATPFGLKAMKELAKIAPRKGEASDAMCLFLAINTSGLAILPTGIIALRAGLGSQEPATILPTTLLATAASTLAGVTAALLLRRLPLFAPLPADALASEETTQSGDDEVMTPRQDSVDGSETRPSTGAAMASAEAPAGTTVNGDTPASEDGADVAEEPPDSWIPLLVVLSALAGLVAAVHAWGSAASAWILPLLIASMVSFGAIRGVKVYEAFLVGAKEGFQLALAIIPYLVAVLAVVSMLRASGGVDALVSAVGGLFAAIGFPAEVLPLALLRPLTGSGAFAITADLAKTHGVDSTIGLIATTMNGSTETTFYVLAVYFGSVGVTRARYAVAAGLTADFVGAIVSVAAVHWLLG